MHSEESYLTDALDSLTLILLFVYTVVESDHTHTRTHTGIWKYFPLFVYVLLCVVLGFGHMS